MATAPDALLSGTVPAGAWPPGGSSRTLAGDGTAAPGKIAGEQVLAAATFIWRACAMKPIFSWGGSPRTIGIGALGSPERARAAAAGLC
ncbi:hypothetical protein M8494_29080 [Serratia ureilytica]